MNFLHEFNNTEKSVISLSLATGKDGGLILYESMIQQNGSKYQQGDSFSPFREEKIIETALRSKEKPKNFDLVGKFTSFGGTFCVENNDLKATLCPNHYVYYDQQVSLTWPMDFKSQICYH